MFDFVERPAPPPVRDSALLQRALTIGAAVLVGFLASALAIALSDLKFKHIILAFLMVGIIPVAALTRQARAIVLVAWILSLTYFRVIFPIESMAGFQGFYVTIADGVFMLAMALWVYDIVVNRQPLVARGRSMLAFILPLVVVCFISALLAQRSDWAIYEVIRIAKIPFFFLYLRYNLGKTEWWIIVAALGFSVMIQGAFGLLQVRGMLGNYQLEAWSPEARANGTLGHASMYSGYMLLILPLMVSLAVTLKPLFARLLCLAAAGAALLGIALAMSRMPWALAALEIVAVGAALVGFRIVTLKRAIGVGCVGGLAAGIAMVPLLGKVSSRINSDFDTAVNWRLKMNEVGIGMWKSQPFFGIGQANFPLYLKGTEMQFSDSLDAAFAGIYDRPGTEEAPEKGFHWVWVPHNIYILLLTETGVLGLAAFLWFLFGSARAVVRAASTRNKVYKSASAGVAIGCCGVLLQNMTDWAMWMDPVIYTLVVLVAMLTAVPTIASEPDPRVNQRSIPSGPSLARAAGAD